MKRLIVNADDFGLNDASTDGIAECFLQGAVTSTTLMVNAPATNRAAKFALEHPGLGVGLHFNLTWGRPLSPHDEVPSLIDANGSFLTRNELARKLLLGKVPGEEIQSELKAQLARLATFGIQLTHIDSHQHIHAFPAVFAVVAASCARQGISTRVPWVAAEANPPLSRRMRRIALKALIWRSTRAWRDKVAWTDGLGSLFDVQDMRMPPGDNHYRRILSGANGRSFELMVHPAIDAGAMTGYTRIGQISEAEWRYLRTGRLSNLVDELGFELCTYREIAG